MAIEGMDYSAKMLEMVRVTLWGLREGRVGEAWSHEDYVGVMALAQEQAVTGLVAQGIIEGGVKLERLDLLEAIGQRHVIQARNAVMDQAVVQLCKVMGERGIRCFVFKGQTIATYYLDSSVRLSGDIDFYVYPEDWERAVAYFREERGVTINDLHTSKDVSFTIGDIIYEMHNRMTLFCYPPHSRYWEEVVMPEIREHTYSVKINGIDVPTLAPTYNALYVFVHIFQHLIADGIGLRQFCDWGRLLCAIGNVEQEGSLLDVNLLDRHLEGLGLKNAYHGLGALLTDCLGLKKDFFPMEITEKDSEWAEELWDNMLKLGNFGHNVGYKHKNMIAHGLEHMWRMTKQSRVFYHYAPAEAWWHLPNLAMWWVKKIGRLAKSKM